jgi:hypothetical protein
VARCRSAAALADLCSSRPVRGGYFVVCLNGIRTEEKVLEAPVNRFAIAVQLIALRLK